MNCDFQTGFCGYTQSFDDHFDWTRKRGSTSSTGTGPAVDHTLATSSGYYVYIETSSGNYGYVARLLSPTLTTLGRHCLEFYYHMYGSAINTLNVYANTTTLGNAIRT
ncbi:hypothetical protein, partial [Salmonella sp. s54395]|uniref:hypothetical protein n=1 Tax=Salmonella sp. s54395 TaxID=3159664 RepID=UPI00397FEF14